MILLKIFYALLLIASWMWLIKYRRNVKSWTGNFMWAEKYLWSWWTYLIMILIGLFLIFVGILYPFGWLDLIFWPTSTDIASK